jgi:uncharacterized protein (TIGR01777 family)
VATIAISGSTGFLGAALAEALRARGDAVWRLVRPNTRTPGASADREVHWDPARGEIDQAALEGVDAVVHLAGESVASGRWTEAQKARIEQSRIQGTRLLASTLRGLRHRPKLWLSASAIGFYGDRGALPLDESQGPGGDFLARVCVAWEAAAVPASEVGVRVVHPRFGVVLDPRGGALARMLPLFRWGMGGKLGDGAQLMSWIALADAVRALLFALDTQALSGPLNLTAPRAVTNAELTRALASVLGRPSFMRVPRVALRAALGELADVALLASANVLPRKLLDAGFVFEHPALEPYLRSVL